MNLEGTTVNRIYNVKSKRGETRFFELWETTSIYSANVFDFHFYKYPLSALQDNPFEKIRRDFLKIFDIQTPYLVKPFETGRFDDTFYLAYQQNQSTSLQVLTNEAVAFPYEIALKIIINVLRGLALLEKKGLHHGLLSPETVWLTDNGSDITNIKISGFLDHYLLPSREITGYGRVQDIRTAGTILAEMLHGTEAIPSWTVELIHTMLEKPETYESIQVLLDFILQRAPEHSILEDSIEERIEAAHKGYGSSFSRSSPGNAASVLEELESPETVPPSKTKKVKEFVSFILSLFRRNKKNKTAAPVAPTIPEEEPETAAPTKESTRETTGKEQPSYGRFPSVNAQEAPKMDPWAVDKSRYNTSPRVPEALSEVPIQHNQSAEKPEQDTLPSSRAPRHETTHPTGSTSRGRLSPVREGMSAEERVRKLSQHREFSTPEPESTEITGSGSYQPEQTPEHEPEQRSVKPAKQGKVTETSQRKTAASPDKTHPQSLPHSDPALHRSFFQRLILWIKNMFTRR